MVPEHHPRRASLPLALCPCPCPSPCPCPVVHLCDAVPVELVPDVPGHLLVLVPGGHPSGHLSHHAHPAAVAQPRRPLLHEGRLPAGLRPIRVVDVNGLEGTEGLHGQILPASREMEPNHNIPDMNGSSAVSGVGPLQYGEYLEEDHRVNTYQTDRQTDFESE